MEPVEFVGIALRNPVVLAKCTMKIAPNFAYRQNIFSGVKMVQWLFLYRIDAKRCHFIVNIGYQFPIIVFPHFAVADLPRAEYAIPGAKRTLY